MPALRSRTRLSYTPAWLFTAGGTERYPSRERGGSMARRIERDEEQRAYAAYFRFAKGHPVDQLAGALSGMAKYKGLEYVVLRDGSRTLAVYRIKNDGHLHRLKRWPAALDED